MSESLDFDVIVVGGGLAGLVASLELVRQGIGVLLIEKRSYPAHKVCGEYVSNEVKPYLERLGLPLDELGAVSIDRLTVSSPMGRVVRTQLDSGGFGISRYTLDYELYRLCVASGVQFVLNTTVTQVVKQEEGYLVQTNNGDDYHAKQVIGAYGKKANLDVKFQRGFTQKTSPYLAVKYHIRYEHPSDLISLHNFEDGYCGMSAIEGGKSCLCYLTTRANLKKSGGSLARMEDEVLGRNPHLRQLFSDAEFLYDKPLVINEISFAKKTQTERGMLMAGDAAGMITPLCGNGMAIAIHTGAIISALLVDYLKRGSDKVLLEEQYSSVWRKTFAKRLAAGRVLQAMFGNVRITDAMVALLSKSPALTKRVISLTHGNNIV